MADELVVAPTGLQTNPSALIASGGGLAECENAICRRPGIVEPRGSFGVAANSAIAAASLTTASGIATLGTTKYIIATDSSSASAIVQNVDSGDRLNLDQINATPRSAVIGQSLAWCLDGGIRMIDDTSALPNAGTRFMGIPRPIGWYTVLNARGGSYDWMATNKVIAYRVVWRRTINDRDYRSAPSDRRTVYNGSGAASSIGHRFTVTSEHLGWYIDLYRSIAIIDYGSQPTDEMRLRISIKVSQADVTAGYIDFYDSSPDADWSGASLYTNATQEGIQSANFAPGYANDIATYQSMTFLAGHRTGGRVTLGLKSIGYQYDGQATLCSIQFAATTASNTTISGVPAAAFSRLAVGQIVTLSSNLTPGSGDATFTADTKVVSWNSGAGTITVDIAAATTGAVTIVCWDWIKVAGSNASRTIYAAPVATATGVGAPPSNYYAGGDVRTAGVFATADSGTAAGFTNDVSDMERAFGSLDNHSSASTSTKIVCWTSGGASSPNKGCFVTFAEVLSFDSAGLSTLGTSTFTVTSTKPYAFDRYVDSSTGVTSAVDGAANRLAWSKLGELEAFPLPQWVELGTDRNTIDRIVATSDVLFVFTREGLFRVAGTTPENISFDLLDPTCRSSAERAGWVTKFGDTAFAWTSRGIVAASTGGVQNIDLAINDIARSHPDILAAYQTTGTYAAADEINGLVLFGATYSSSQAPFCYVYCVQSGAWQSFYPYICGTRFLISSAATDGDGSLLVGTSGQVGYGVYVESPVRDTTSSSVPYRYDYYDSNGSYTDPALSNFSGATFTITAAASVVDVAVGDALQIGVGTTPYYVTAVNGTAVTVDRTVNPTAATCTVYKAFETTVTYVASTEGAPMVEKKYTDATLNFGVIRYGRNYTISTGRYGETSTTSQTIVYDSALTSYAPAVKQMATRRTIPTDQGRGIAIALTFTQRQAAAYWQLMAARVSYQPITDKVNRGQS